ncbi:germacradienol/geosmin synthase/pentalenene synthase [Lentzea atacamensis]|uniref:Terpene synthase n=1 Tax=Lentzea atacamensis TaxID=531938 RepID=A0A316HI78_9PSEU|nr:pentalenene synthase [Lentzea atacamensis]PWK77975.1 germacradienol/geosmin synthase/pentalenene synthase [Lentzea atacamensis]
MTTSAGFPREEPWQGRVEFDIPFAPQINQHLAQASSQLLSWITEFGLLRSCEAVDHFVSWRPAELPARWFPDASASDLQLGTDLLAWLMLLDDQFDGPLGRRPNQVMRVVAELIKVFDPRDVGRQASAPAAVQALEDLWAREQEGMTARWRARAARNWCEYLRSFVTEADNRRRDHIPDTAEYLELRDKTGIMYVLLDAAERVGRYEVPEPVYQSPAFQEMYRLTVLVASVVNDLLGLKKEETRGDPHNLVLVLQRQRTCSRTEALAETVAMVRGWTNRFLQLEALIPGVCDDLHIAITDRVAGYRLIGAMRAAMRASYDWCAISERYASESIAFLGTMGCLDDIVTTTSQE